MNESQSIGGFNIRLEARLKNAELVKARELSGLSPKELSEKIGVSYGYYLNCENMRYYPSKETQKKICGFFREQGVFLIEEEVFPIELGHFRNKYKKIIERRIPKEKLVSLNQISQKLLPTTDICNILEESEFKDKLNASISQLDDYGKYVIKMRFGLDGNREHTEKEIAELLGLNLERVKKLEEESMLRLKRSQKSKWLEDYLENK